MRPVNKGISPTEKFSNYKDAAAPLKDRLGSYCSYCERHIETHLAVEHVVPKYIAPEIEGDWDNFLLGCANCNSSKGTTSINESEYFWPHRDNTIKYFNYKNSLVSSRQDLSVAQRRKADSLVCLVGLDRDPGNPNMSRRPTNSDKRWLFRKDLWDFAKLARELLATNDIPALRNLIIDSAVSRGGFGIWFAVFCDDEDMCQRLVRRFPGTAHYYFGRFGILAVPVHVLRVLDAIFEEVDMFHKNYTLKVIVPEKDFYQRVRVDLGFKDATESEKYQIEFENFQSRSIWISMIEYPAIPSVSKNKITIIVFEQRLPSAYSITRTRHYVDPSHEGQNVMISTFRPIAVAVEDIKNFLLKGDMPTIGIL